MSELKAKIENLKRSTHFQNIKDHKPPFDQFNIIGLNENRYLNVLRWLLKDEINSDFQQKFMQHIEVELKQYGIQCGQLIDVEREFNAQSHGRPDLLLTFAGFTLVIEVKIYESAAYNEQIQRYQNFLTRFQSSIKRWYCLPLRTKVELQGSKQTKIQTYPWSA